MIYNINLITVIMNWLYFSQLTEKPSKDTHKTRRIHTENSSSHGKSAIFMVISVFVTEACIS